MNNLDMDNEVSCTDMAAQHFYIADCKSISGASDLKFGVDGLLVMSTT